MATVDLTKYSVQKKLNRMDVDLIDIDLTTKAGLAAFRNLLAVSLGEMTATKVIGPSGEDVDKGTLMDFVPKDALSNAERSIQKKFEEAEQGAYAGSETNKLLQQIDRTETSDVPDTKKNITDYFQEISQNKSIPDGSRLSGAIDPNRAALAFGPNDILAQQRPRYAAQGGIMSTNKAFQRVA